MSADEIGGEVCRFHMKKGDCPECALDQVSILNEELESKEKELATAKAENARLASALKGLQWPTKKGDSKVSLAKAESDAEQALSSSNALDYWQGEVRKAKSEGIANAVAAILDVMRSAEFKQRGDKAKCTRGWINLIETSLSRLASNPQSKGEKGEG